MAIHELQSFMTAQHIAGWLIADFRNSNPILARLLPLPLGHATGRRHLTRRAMLWIPRGVDGGASKPEGSSYGGPLLGAKLLCHHIDRGSFTDARLWDGSPVQIDTYLAWPELHAWISARAQQAGVLEGSATIAMEYSPGNALPVVGVVDAGTVELVRAAGAAVVSSANLIQLCIARWTAAALESHVWASAEVARIKDEAFALVRERLRTGVGVTELDVYQHIRKLFDAAGLETPDGPIVAVNAHGADPHFEVSHEQPAAIRKGDWILLDLWARRPGDQHIFSDITWCAFAAGPGGTLADVPARHQRVFQAVKAARDAAVQHAQARHRAGESAQGWELDEAARQQIVGVGFGAFIKHRTGHSLSAGPMVHGVGVNIDNLETHDTRLLMPGVGFTVEPGAYLPDGSEGPGFGVRLEINCFVDPQSGPRVTSCIQNDVVLV